MLARYGSSRGCWRRTSACRGGCRRSLGWPRSWCCPPGTVWPGGLPCPWTRRDGGRRGMPRDRSVRGSERGCARPGCLGSPDRHTRSDRPDLRRCHGGARPAGARWALVPEQSSGRRVPERAGSRRPAPILRYLDVSYRAWAEFTGAIRAGQGSGFITRLTVDCLTWAGEPARSWSASSAAIPPSSAGCSSFRTWSPWPGKTSRSNLR
jgi:hypothetical protein